MGVAQGEGSGIMAGMEDGRVLRGRDVVRAGDTGEPVDEVVIEMRGTEQDLPEPVE